MKPIYITQSNENSNQLTLNPNFKVRNGTGIAHKLRNKIVYEKPSDGEYYYYIFFDNQVVTQFNLFRGGTVDEPLYIPEDVMSDVNSGKCKVILDHGLEGFSKIAFNAENFKKYVDGLNGNYVYLTGDYLCDTNEIVNSKFVNYWETRKFKMNTFDNIVFQSYCMKKLNMKTPAKFKAICKNRLLRIHRIAIIKRIHEYDLTRSINYSFGIVTQHGPIGALNYVHRDYTSAVVSSSRKFNYDPQELLAWVTRHGEKNLYHEQVDLSINHASTLSEDLYNAHLDSYFEIIVETNFIENTIFPTEKTYKAIYFMQPFVLCAERGAVQFLRDSGYDVFDDIIDHSYDVISDPDERLHAVFSEISRLCNIKENDWLIILNDIKDRLIANFEHLNDAKTNPDRIITDW